MLRKILLLAVLIVLASQIGTNKYVYSAESTLQRNEIITLSSALSTSLNQNREILQARKEVSRRRFEIESIEKERFPKFGAIAFTGQQVEPNGQFNLAVLPSVFQPITQQYRLALRIHAAKVELKQAEEAYRLIRQSTAAKVHTLYMNLMTLQAVIHSRAAEAAFLKDLQYTVRQFELRGSALQAEVLAVTARFATIDYQLEKARDEYITKSQQLNRLMGREPMTSFSVENLAMLDEAPANYETAYRSAFDNRPEMRDARLQSTRLGLERKITLSEYIPNVSIGGTGIFAHNLDITLPKDFFSFGALATWDFWDWGRKTDLARAKQEQVGKANIHVADLADQIKIDVDNARRAVLLAKKRYAAAILNEASTREQLRVSAKRYKVGAALLPEVLRTEADFAASADETANAISDYWISRAELSKALGEDK